MESKQTLRGLFCKNVSVTLNGIYILFILYLYPLYPLSTCLVFCCQYVFDDHSSIITGSLYILRKGLESFVGHILWKKFVNLSKKNLKSFLVSSSVQTFSRFATQWCDVVVIILPWGSCLRVYFHPNTFTPLSSEQLSLLAITLLFPSSAFNDLFSSSLLSNS